MVILSLALGVAIFVSSYESIVAAQESIRASANAMDSKAQWQVSQGRYLGIDEAFVSKIRQEPGALAVPVIETSIALAGNRKGGMVLIGVDLDSDQAVQMVGKGTKFDPSQFVPLKLIPNSVLIPALMANRMNLKVGDSISVDSVHGAIPITVAGILTDPRLELVGSGQVGIMDIHGCQAITGQTNPARVDRIDVFGVSKERLASLCPGCQVDQVGKLSSAASDALGRINSLLGVSVIALLVGVLLIYNSVQVSVLERLKDIAIIRALGATRRQVLGFLLIEWFVIGIIGSLFGLVMGLGLAFALVEYTKRTINSMVPLMAEAHVRATPQLIAVSLIVGVGTALSAAFFPIWMASKVKPLEILRPYSYRRVHQFVLATTVGIALFVIGNGVIATVSLSVALGLCVTAIVFLGVSLVFPQVVLMLAKAVRPWLVRSKRPEMFLGLDGLIKAPHRTAFTMMTFGCALAMTVATETLVQGFQSSTDRWMQSAFPFDISVMGNDIGSSVYGNQVLSEHLVDDLRHVNGVTEAYGVRKLLTPFHDQDVMGVGVDTDRYIAARAGKKMEPWPPNLLEPKVFASFQKGTGMFISSNFESLHQVHLGDSVSFQSPKGRVNLTVLGVIDDLSWPHGAFIVDRGLFKREWNDNVISYVDLSISNPSLVPAAKAEAQAVASRSHHAFAYDRKEIRDVTESVLRQAVQMANLQATIAVVIGMMGIVNAIWIGVMNRRKEIALWRSIGITQGQILRIILWESGFIAAVAAVIGIGGGLYGGWVPLRAFSFYVTGYLYPMVVPWNSVLSIGTLSILLGLASGVLPARYASKLPILDAIGYE